MTVLDTEDPADPSPHEPRVIGAPDHIWLVYGDLERDDTHEECSRHGDVTWCEDAQFSSDVRYVRADLYEQAKASELRAYTKLLGMHKSAKEHRDRVRELEAELDRLMAADDAARVIQWATSNPRKPANVAFTAGPERQIAYWIEWAEARERARLTSADTNIPTQG